MNKINIQALTLGSKLNPMDSKDGDILGGLFSIPLIENDSKNTKEFIFPSNFFKSIKSGDSQDISNLLTNEKMYTNLKNFSKENFSKLKFEEYFHNYKNLMNIIEYEELMEII